MKVLKFGKEFGDSSPKYNEDNFIQNLEKAEEAFGKILVLRPGFVNLAYVFKREDLGGAVAPLPTSFQSYRMKVQLDCVFAPTEIFGALAIANADCPIFAGLVENEEGREYLFMAHCGTSNLIPNNGYLSMIYYLYKFWREKKITIKELYAGAGIGPCCYGLSSIDALYEKYPTVKKFKTATTKGPRASMPSINLLALIDHQLHASFNGDFPLQLIHYDKECTACAPGKEKERKFFSNVYNDGTKRNLTIVGI